MRLAKPCVVCGDVVEFIIPDSPQWISVEDDLPGHFSFVLVVVRKNNINIRVPVIGRYCDDGKWRVINWYNSSVADGITHWMEQPKEATA